MNAIISECGRYRYSLQREADPDGRESVLFVMLNPSTADAMQDDPTIRRCVGFARAWGASELLVGNLFAYRATQPDELYSALDPIGPDNDFWLRSLSARSAMVVCAWGAHPMAKRRAIEVRAMLGREIHHLGLTKDGAPKHPLYLPAILRPMLWDLTPVTFAPKS
jgi:hypothetical protein